VPVLPVPGREHSKYVTESVREAPASRTALRRVHGGWWLVRNSAETETLLRTKDRDEAVRLCGRLNMDAGDGLDDPLIRIRLVRDHLHWLLAEGVGLHQVAIVARVKRDTLRRILRVGKRPVTWCRRDVADRILAVGRDDVADGAVIDARATWELLDCMLRAGWPKARIARALGRRTPALQIRRDHVLVPHGPRGPRAPRPRLDRRHRGSARVSARNGPRPGAHASGRAPPGVAEGGFSDMTEKEARMAQAKGPALDVKGFHGTVILKAWMPCIDRVGTLAFIERLWDHDAAWLQSIERYIDNVRRDAPSWWALPWVVEAHVSQKEPSAP
jgi:hypothetical protein